MSRKSKLALCLSVTTVLFLLAGSSYMAMHYCESIPHMDKGWWAEPASSIAEITYGVSGVVGTITGVTSFFVMTSLLEDEDE